MPWKKSPPQNNYYAVIFSSTKSDNLEGYLEMDEETMHLAQEQPGFLGYESVNNGNTGIFVSYWESMDAINGWRQNSTHLMAKAKAEQWYKRYLSQICKVEHSHLMEK
ncbi:MAG: antibiotic biosynthesis monooxygenase [Bacteroidia bacterium]|nr:antibiotic biosynthesis monooxygenase [Bacteroidia bacterium]